MTATELIDALKSHWGIQSDAQLGDLLEESRQSVHQYKKRKSTDLQTKIIVRLLAEASELRLQLTNNQESMRSVIAEELAKQKG